VPGSGASRLVPIGYRINGLVGRLLGGGTGMTSPTLGEFLEFGVARGTVGRVLARRRVVVCP
jgi:hypothetical protein